MEFLIWHYTKGLKFYIKRWFAYFDWVNHYFSVPLLIKTFFAPWKRLVVTDKSPGFNLGKFIEKVTFNIISRGIGACVRFSLFWVGLVLIVSIYLFGIAGLVTWLIFPIAGLPIYTRINKQPEHFINR